MVQNLQYLTCPPSRMTLPFKYQTPILSGIQLNSDSDAYCISAEGSLNYYQQFLLKNVPVL